MAPLLHRFSALVDIHFFARSNLCFLIYQYKKQKKPSEMASSSLANVSVSLPFSSQRNVGAQASSCSTRFQSTFPNCRMIMVGNRDYYSHNSIRAIAGGDGRRDNLDHLQKASKTQQPTTQTNKRVAQPIGLWDRYPTARTVQQMMDTMERMMEDPVAYSNSSWSSPSVPRDNGTGGSGGSYRRGRTPWEIKEGEQDYQMRFDMPGMTKGDVKVWVEEKMLVVKAEKASKNNEETQKENENEQVWSSKSYGRYNFRIALPENVEFEKIKAEVKDGVLYISIPKATTSSKILDINVQ